MMTDFYTEKIYYENLVSRVIKSLRGDISQIDLSRKLGYSFNQVGKWESSVKKIYFVDFAKICSACDSDLPRIFKNVLHVNYHYGDSVGEVMQQVIKLYYKKRTSDVLRNLNLTQSKYDSIVEGDSDLDLISFLTFIHFSSARLDDFLAGLFNIEDPSAYYSKNMIEIYRDHPKAALVYCAIHTQTFKDSNDAMGSLSELTGLSRNEVEFYIKEFFDKDLIYNDNGLKCRVFKVNIRREDSASINASISHMNVDYLKASIGDYEKLKGFFRVAPVSKRVRDEIRDILIETNGKITSLIEAEDDSEKTEVVSFILSTLDH